MNKKDFARSIILNAFIGYLWVLFSFHIVRIANSMDNVFFVGGIIMLIGYLLFWEIVKRVTPFKEYKNTHPVKIAGGISLCIVVLISLFFKLY